MLNLKKRTIYKWFWDTHKSEKAKTELVKKMKLEECGPDNKDNQEESKDNSKKDVQVEGKDG